jgi:hypothetical protein
MKPRAIMSDCALAIAKAVAEVFATTHAPPQHYWCLFHVLKAFKGKAKKYLNDQWTNAFQQFRSIMYSQTDPTAAFAKYNLQWAKVSPSFYKYVQHQWAGRIHNWAIYFQTVSQLSRQALQFNCLLTSLLSTSKHPLNRLPTRGTHE